MRKVETEELRLVEAGADSYFDGLFAGLKNLFNAFGTKADVLQFGTNYDNKLFYIKRESIGKFTLGVNFLKLFGINGGLGAILGFFGIGIYEKPLSLIR